MRYGNMPLYPALRPGGGSACVTMPLFDDGLGGVPGRGGPPGRGGLPGLPAWEEAQRVIVENPCRPGERAEVLLAVDSCGNLSVCVRREADCCRRESPCRPRPCLCPPRGPSCHRPKDRCGRLYGSWEE